MDDLFLCRLLFGSPLERDAFAGKSSDWCRDSGEVLDEHSMVARNTQEASCLPEVEDVSWVFRYSSDLGWVDGCAVF